MALVPLEELTRPLTRDEVEAKIYEVLALIGVSTTSWKPGAVVRTMIAACSILLAAFSTLTANIARSGFLELAEGKWLALVAYHVYGVEKRYATLAAGQVTLTNEGGGTYALDADELTLINVITGKTYRNTASFTLDALSTLTIDVYAVEYGSASTAIAGTITIIQSPSMPAVTVANALAVVGLDEERDPSLRARCAEKLGALSPNGPWDAYSYAARNALRDDGSPVAVTRVRTSKDGYGIVTTYVATATGAVTGPDLLAVDEAIQMRAAPLAVTAFVLSATPVTIAVSYRVWLYNTSGLSEAQITSAISARLALFMSGQPIGGNVLGAGLGAVFHDALRTVIGSTLPQIFHVELVTPAGDTSLAISAVPVLGTVTALAINQVPPSEGLL